MLLINCCQNRDARKILVKNDEGKGFNQKKLKVLVCKRSAEKIQGYKSIVIFATTTPVISFVVLFLATNMSGIISLGFFSY